MEIKEIWNIILEYGIATEDELILVTGLIGYNEDTLNDIIYFRTGYRDIQQFLEYHQ